VKLRDPRFSISDRFPGSHSGADDRGKCDRADLLRRNLDWNSITTGDSVALTLDPRFLKTPRVRYLRILAWTLVVGITVVTVVPASDRPGTGVEHHFEHLLAFGLVGLVFALAYSWRLKMLLPSGVVFALLLELAQIPLPTRHARIEDFLVDAFGVSLGIMLAYLTRRPSVV
jgi:VanZ family protein